MNIKVQNISITPRVVVMAALLLCFGSLSVAAQNAVKANDPSGNSNQRVEVVQVGQGSVEVIRIGQGSQEIVSLSGLTTLGEDGSGIIELPSEFQSLKSGYRYQLTPVGASAPQLHIAKEVTDNHFKIAGGLDGLRVSWTITIVLHNYSANANPIVATDNMEQKIQDGSQSALAAIVTNSTLSGSGTIASPLRVKIPLLLSNNSTTPTLTNVNTGNGDAVTGISSGRNGVSGRTGSSTDAGGYFYNTSATGNGAWGYSPTGTGSYGQSNTGIGLRGYSPGGFGVQGYGNIAVMAEGAGSGATALSLSNGSIQVKGAGVGTATPVFTHRVTSANRTPIHRTIIDHPYTNNNPNAILIVTPSYNPGGSCSPGCVLNNHPIGVFYNNGKWEVYNQDFAEMVIGGAFNVLVVKP